MKNPINTIGYCAIVGPQIDHWQGYFILNDPELQKQANVFKDVAMKSMLQADPYGTLQAALVECALKNQQGGVAAAALALRDLSGADYFYITFDKQPQGTATSLHRLNATTVPAARAEIEKLPQVLTIKKNLTEKLSMRDGMGRRRAVH